MIAVLNWSLHHWYLFFWLWVVGLFDSVREFLAGIANGLAGIGERRHQRKLETIRASFPAAPPARPLPVPGPCVHRNVKQVRDVNDELVGWLCVSCDTQKPADWATLKEDL